MMKAIMVIIDGLADEKMNELNGQTTYESAHHPNLDRLAAGAVTGYFDSCPQGYTPESMPCILNLLGIDPVYYPQSRASLELLANGYKLEDDEVVLRCNLAAVDNSNHLISFNGGNLTHIEMKKAVEAINDTPMDIRLIHLSDYRNLLIMKKRYFQALRCKNYPPHEYVGDNVDVLLADICAKAPILKEFVSAAMEKLKNYREDKLTYILYPWGISEKSSLPTFQELYSLNAAAVCGTEIARGIAIALGMTLANPTGMTGDTDTDLILKAKTTCAMLDNHDFVFVHINGTDEAAHRYDLREKISFIERIDREFFRIILDELSPDTRIYVCADHGTSPLSGKHTVLDVPYIIKKPFWKNEMSITTAPGALTELKAADVLNYLLTVQ
ncbi:alkaline phosphatase family protein [Dehalobacter sp. DCM]|uniref:alkaline phosphatase family protein n=1 Tax=Dehalobacter sp. DCM TaxID=2907827 RepID=UPI003081EDBE|nr:alkaline phosphatase family protein [Dehalobacter sp. DCM]